MYGRDQLRKDWETKEGGRAKGEEQGNEHGPQGERELMEENDKSCWRKTRGSYGRLSRYVLDLSNG